MKHIKSIGQVKVAECNGVMALIAGKIADDSTEYVQICAHMGSDKKG